MKKTTFYFFIFFVILTCSIFGSEKDVQLDGSSLIGHTFLENTFWGLSNFRTYEYSFGNDYLIVTNHKENTYAIYSYIADEDYIFLEPVNKNDNRLPEIYYEYDYFTNKKHSNYELTLLSGDFILKLKDEGKFRGFAEDLALSLGIVSATLGVSSFSIAKVEAYNKVKLAQSTLNKNTELGRPINSMITNGTTSYQTDSLGRTVSASGKVQLGATDRNKNLTAKIGKLGVNNNTNSDQGGHLIADVLGGKSDVNNLAPMNSSLNQGAYKSHELYLRNQSMAGHDILVNVKPIYSDNSNRPIRIIYDYWIDKIKYTKVFENITGGINGN